MNKKSSKKRSETDWARIDALRDEDIDFSDIPEQGEEFFEAAMLRLPKKTVCIRLDADVLEWFKAQGKGYQSRINAVLRAHKETGGAS